MKREFTPEELLDTLALVEAAYRHPKAPKRFRECFERYADQLCLDILAQSQGEAQRGQDNEQNSTDSRYLKS